MDLQTWSVVNDYYVSAWKTFSPKDMRAAFDPNIVLYHKRQDYTANGIDEVMAWYEKYFFTSVILDSTRVFTYEQRVTDRGLLVSYLLRQTHKDRGDAFGQINDWITLSSESHKIVRIEIDPHAVLVKEDITGKKDKT